MYISQPVLQAAYQAEGLALDYYKGILALRSFAARLAWGKILSYTHEPCAVLRVLFAHSCDRADSLDWQPEKLGTCKADPPFLLILLGSTQNRNAAFE